MLHRLDDLAAMLISRPRLFQGGWGSETYLNQILLHDDHFGEPPDVTPQWGPQYVVSPKVMGRKGTFRSPGFTGPLPPESETAYVEWLYPKTTSEPPPTYILFAATHEEGFRRRRSIFLPLVREGYGAIILENPFYGRRRPKGQSMSRIRTVDENFIMSGSCVQEGRGLLQWLTREGYLRLGAAGFSMGGYSAGHAAGRVNMPMAVVPCGAGLSPAPSYTQEALSRSVDWNALGPEEPRPRLTRLLNRIAETLPNLNPKSKAIIVAAKNDAFVPATEASALQAHWPGSELRWISGGHVSTHLWGGKVIRQALKDAIAHLEPAAK